MQLGVSTLQKTFPSLYPPSHGCVLPYYACKTSSKKVLSSVCAHIHTAQRQALASSSRIVCYTPTLANPYQHHPVGEQRISNCSCAHLIGSTGMRAAFISHFNRARRLDGAIDTATPLLSITSSLRVPLSIAYGCRSRGPRCHAHHRHPHRHQDMAIRRTRVLVVLALATHALAGPPSTLTHPECSMLLEPLAHCAADGEPREPCCAMTAIFAASGCYWYDIHHLPPVHMRCTVYHAVRTTVAMSVVRSTSSWSAWSCRK